MATPKLTTRDIIEFVLGNVNPDTNYETSACIIVSGADLLEKANAMLESLNAKNIKRKSTESKDKREARERREAVAAFLDAHEGEVFTRDAIAESVGITPGEASAACKVLITEGIVTKTEVKVDKARKVGYSIVTDSAQYLDREVSA